MGILGELLKTASESSPLGLISSGVGAVTDIANTVVGAVQNKKQRQHETALQEDAQTFNAEQAQLNRDFQSKEAELAYERQLDYFDKTQSASAQVEQYKKAGLNPALLAGGISVGSSSPQSSPSGSTASSGISGSSMKSLPAIANVMDTFLKAKRMEAEIENIQADTDQKEKNTSWIDALNSGKIENMKAAASNLLADSELKQSQIDVNLKSIESMGADIAVKYDSLETARVARAKIQQEIDVMVDGLLTSAKMRGVYDKQMGKLAQEIKILAEEYEVVSDGMYKQERKYSVKIDNDNKEAQTRFTEAQETLSYLKRKGEEKYGLASDDPFMVGLNYLGAILGNIGKVFSTSASIGN